MVILIPEHLAFERNRFFAFFRSILLASKIVQFCILKKFHGTKKGRGLELLAISNVFYLIAANLSFSVLHRR